MKNFFRCVFCCCCLINALFVVAQEPLATSQACVFSVDSSEDSPYAISNQTMIEAWKNRKINWRKGDSVHMVSPDGTRIVLVENANNAGSIEVDFTQGGLWRLVNSSQGEVVVGVAWTVYNDGGILAENAVAKMFYADSKKDGPNRRVFSGKNISVAYSAALFAGMDMVNRELHLISPSAEESSYQAQGAIAQPFCFSENGVWTVSLTADGVTQSASILVKDQPLAIILR